MGYKTLRKALMVAGLAIGSVGLTGVAHAGASADMLSNACAACHGEGGNSTGPAIPGIAGLSRGYFIAAMMAYKYGDDEDAIMKAVTQMPLDTDDFEAYPRSSTIMGRIARGYTDEEIAQMAEHFSTKKFVRHAQDTDSGMVKKGRKLHEKHCEKCHEDGGRTSEDDVGLLAGQWAPYLENTMNDFINKHRKMPKKMSAKMKKIDANDVSALVQYYASQK